MGRFYGPIGYATTVEVRPGVWEDVIVEYNYYGNVLRNARGLESDEKVNFDLTVSNRISVLADAYAREHFFAMRYIKWAGVLWIVDNVEVRNPRLVLRLGGVYNGPTPSPSGNP